MPEQVPSSGAATITEGRRGSDRLEAFSDSVMAVIITIMAFDLRAPAGSSLHALSQRLPALLIYVLSFTAVGMAWNHHHQLFRATEHISDAVMWANLHSLFWLSLVPVFTEWVGDQYRAHLPASGYGVVALGSAAAYGIPVRTIIGANGKGSAVATAIGSDRKGYVSIALYATGASLAWVSPWISYSLYVGVAVVWFMPDRRFSRTRPR